MSAAARLARLCMVSGFTTALTLALTPALTLVSAGASAASLYNTLVDPLDYTGSRSTDPSAAVGGLTGNAQWSTDFHVSWEIVDNGDGSLTYSYTFTGFGSPDRDISNFVLDISDNCVGIDPLCIVNPTLNGAPISADDIEYGDINGITGAVKFDVGPEGVDSATYVFTSNRLPVWGHLAMKDGGGSDTCASGSFGSTALVCSNQLLGIGLDSDKINFVARPNGVAVIPVPAAVWLFGSALLLLPRLRRQG
jgi:hypothetical protein